MRSSNDEWCGSACGFVLLCLGGSFPGWLGTRARRSVALGAALGVLGAGRFHVYAFKSGQAREPGENVGELLFEVGPVTLAHGSCELAGFLDQPAKRAVPAAPAILVEVDVTNALLELGDGQRVSIAKKRGGVKHASRRKRPSALGKRGSDARSLQARADDHDGGTCDARVEPRARSSAQLVTAQLVRLTWDLCGVSSNEVAMLHQMLSEDELVQIIQRTVESRDRVRLGIGDDAAVLKDGTVITTDAYAEGVHFDLSYMNLRQVGERCACGAISDVVAMAAEPEAVLVSLALPAKRGRGSGDGGRRTISDFRFQIAESRVTGEGRQPLAASR